MWDFYPRGSIGKNSMWDFYPRGRLVRIPCRIFTSEGCASKNDARFLRRRVARQKQLVREACARGVGEGKRENRFIRMEIVPVSNEPIGVVAVPSMCSAGSSNGLCFLQLLHIGVNHGNGRDVDHILHRTFKVGEVDGAI